MSRYTQLSEAIDRHIAAAPNPFMKGRQNAAQRPAAPVPPPPVPPPPGPAKKPGILGVIGFLAKETAAKATGKLLNTKVRRQAQIAQLRAQKQAETNAGRQTAIQANINRLQGEITAINAKATEAAAAAKTKAEENAAAAKTKVENATAKAKELRNAVVAARIRLNTGESSSNNRRAYATALQAYRNARLSERNIVTLGINKYDRTGAKRSTTTTTTTTARSASEYIRNVKQRLEKADAKTKKKLLDDAISNLNKRLTGLSNKNALIMIGDYGTISSNTNFRGRINRRAEPRKAKKNENKNKNKKGGPGGWSGGGQQIIFGGGPPGAGGAAVPPQFINRGGASPGPGAAAPVFLPGGGGAGPSMTGPTITVAPTLKVNVPPAAAQAATQMLPPMERSALNNAGGYRRAATLVQNAGGPESVSRALTALRNSGGNVERAMQNTGMPRNVFNSVNKLGGPVTARRTLTAVKKVSKKTTGRPSTFNLGRPSSRRPSSVRPATVNLVRVAPPRRKKATKKKKRVSSACATCKKPRDNHIRLIVSQLRRINLERNYLKCLLP